MSKTVAININMDAACKRCGKKGAPDGGFCLDCVSKAITPFRVPTEDDFSDSPFSEDIRLEKLGEDLIAEYEDFAYIQTAKILYLWKEKGGKSGGKDVLGKCQKPSGLLAHFARADFVIWLGADNVRDRHMKEEQIKALLFHELKHCGFDHETGDFIVVGHEFEGFAREIELFGYWREDIHGIAAACEHVRQGELFQTPPQPDNSATGKAQA